METGEPTIGDIVALYIRAGAYFLLLCALVAAPAVFVWHARSVYLDELAHVNAHAARSRDMLENFCEKDPAARMDMHECADAKAFLARNLDREVLERVIDEHLEHLPLVHYCRTTSTCRDMLVLYADTIRTSLFWCIVSVPIALAIVVLACLRWPGGACSRASQARKAYVEGAGVRIPTTQ